jgi:hypothetical protein
LYKCFDGPFPRDLIAPNAFAALVLSRAQKFGFSADLISPMLGEFTPDLPQERIEVGDWLPHVLGHDATPFSPNSITA